MRYYPTGKKGFYKEWKKSGKKYWFNALIDTLLFLWMFKTFQTIKSLTEDVEMAYVMGIAITTAIFLLNTDFIGKVLEDMKEKDYLTIQKELKNCYNKPAIQVLNEIAKINEKEEKNEKHSNN